MPRFVCRTREGTDPEKKVRVYFTCHEDDFDEYFEDICAQILKVLDCAVYYTEDMGSWYSPAELVSELEMMDIIVIPISFVWHASQNRSHETEFFYARENHIPILPIMVEEKSGEYWKHSNWDVEEILPYRGGNYEEALRVGLARFEGEERDLLSDFSARVDKMCRAGKYDKAMCLQEKLYELLLEKYGKLHVETLNALHGMAFIENLIGDHDSALYRYNQVYDGRCELLSEKHLDTLGALHNISFTLGKLGRHDEAIEGFLAVYEDKKKIYGCENEDTLLLMEDVAVEYRHAGKYAESAGAYEKCYNICCELYGKEDGRTVDAMYEVVGKYSLAEDYYAEVEFTTRVYEYFSSICHEHDFPIVRIVSVLAEANRKQLHHKDAVFWYEKLYEARRAKDGEEAVSTLEALHGLAFSYSMCRKSKKAVELYEILCDARVRVLGEAHIDTIRALEGLSAAYYNCGESERAVDIDKRICKITGTAFGADHEETLRAYGTLAYSYLNEQDFENARGYYEHLWQLTLEKFGDAHPETVSNVYFLARAYEGLGNLSNAAKYMELAYLGEVKYYGEESRDTVDTLEALVDILMRARKFAKAEIYADTAYTLGEKLYGECDHFTLKMMLCTAHAERECSHLSSALAKYCQLHNSFSEKYGDDDEDAMLCLYYMALINEELWNYREAAKYYYEHYLHCRRLLGEDDEHTKMIYSKYLKCDKY